MLTKFHYREASYLMVFMVAKLLPALRGFSAIEFSYQTRILVEARHKFAA